MAKVKVDKRNYRRMKKEDNKKVPFKPSTEEGNDKEFIEKVKEELRKEMGQDSNKWRKERGK